MKSLRFSTKALAFALTTFMICTVASAQATRTWVSGVGDDANPCSRTAPCKTFAGAISKTAATGEIDCLDPGGFGEVTITKSIIIDCQAGVGSILVSGTNGVIINANSATDVVTLRNLSINGIGTGLSGVSYLSAKAVHLENVRIYSFTTAGVTVNASAQAKLIADNVTITDSQAGITLATSFGTAIGDLRNVRISNIATDCVRGGVNSFISARESNLSICNVGLNQTASGSSAVLVNNQVLKAGVAVQSIGGSTAAIFGNTFAGNTTTLNSNGGTIFTDQQNNIPFNPSNGVANGGPVTKM